jgi:uncharacterized protein
MRELREAIIHLWQVPPEGARFQGAIPPERLPRLAEAVEALNAPVAVDLDLTPEDDAYLLSGDVDGSVVLECESCRVHFDFPLAARLFLTVDPNPEKALYRDRSQKGEVWVVDHADEQIDAPEGQFDLIEALEDEWLLELPLSPRCDENCRGICPVCGTNRNEAECGCSPPPRESPFDVLAQLKKNE